MQHFLPIYMPMYGIAPLLHLSFLKNVINIALSWDVRSMATGIMRGCWRLSDEIAFMVGGKEPQCGYLHSRIIWFVYDFRS
jgi:hypothetical protein